MRLHPSVLKISQSAMNGREFIVGQAPGSLPTTGADLGQPVNTLWLLGVTTLVLVIVVGIAWQRRTSV